MKRSITVTGKTELRSGTSASGRDWTLWELTARDASGPIHEKLKSFDSLEIGVPIPVELEPDEREEGCYLVRAAKGQRGGSSSGVIDRLDALETKVDWLTQQVVGGTSFSPTPAPEQPTLDEPPPQVPEEDLDDIPF
jgi:hypothetical protein